MNWASDAGSVWDKALGIMWSNDWEDKSKTPHIPWEFKTSRKPKEMNVDRDLDLYCEQLLIYMVAQGSTTGRLVVLQPNLPAPRGKVGVVILSIERTLYRSRLRISNCIKANTPNSKGVGGSTQNKEAEGASAMPRVQAVRCPANCPIHWDELCKPEGRYGKEGIPEKAIRDLLQ